MKHPTQDQLEQVTDVTMDLAALKFFPDTTAGQLAVAKLILRTVDSVEEARRLVNTIIENFDDWPGPASMLDRYYRMKEAAKPKPPWMTGIPTMEETEVSELQDDLVKTALKKKPQ